MDDSAMTHGNEFDFNFFPGFHAVPAIEVQTQKPHIPGM
jgi:hypothetical protein